MHYVIVRDDDTNALTPVECLETLYRPFLERGLPVNLGVIPYVNTQTQMHLGVPEGFLFSRKGGEAENIPIRENKDLVFYLLRNPLFQIVQHGYQHAFNEFETHDRREICYCLERGTEILIEAGFPRPQTFIAPYDQFSKESLEEVASRFDLISSGWYEMKKLPLKWWPFYALKKFCYKSHWSVGNKIFLTHPGCLLSHKKPLNTILEEVKQSIASRKLTVLVTHWWEYFIDGPNDPFIEVLHQTLDYLANAPDIEVISFESVISHKGLI